MTFAEFLKQERASQTISEFANYLGVGHESITRWENGDLPRYQTVNDIAVLFGWSDDKRMALMPKPLPKSSRLSQKLLRHVQYYDISMGELGEYFGRSKSTVSNWVHGSIPEVHQDAVRAFIALDDQAMSKIFRKFKRKAKPKRGKLNIKLVQKIERKYGKLSDCPEDEELLGQLRKELRV